MDTHLIWPSDTSKDYTTRHKLCPFQKWLNLTHQDMFIHGPFEFATVDGQKMQDHVSQADWDVIQIHLDIFHNPLPWFDVPSYSIHIDRGAHVLFHDAAITHQLILLTSHAQAAPGRLHFPCQKVVEFQAYHPSFFFLSTYKCASLGYAMLRGHGFWPPCRGVSQVWKYGTWCLILIVCTQVSPSLKLVTWLGTPY